MRRSLIVLALLFFALPAAAQPKDLAKARERDREGAKAYGEGRYADAIRAFDEAYHLGGPPFELWNIAKCHLRLDQPEQAAELLEKYLQTPNLPKDDRDEAAQQLDQLKKRSSTLTVTSSPSGATVIVDGKEIQGVTPLTTSVAPGPHTVKVTAPTGVPFSKAIEARYGRALIVDAPLKEGDLAPRPPPPANPYDKKENALALRAAIAAVFPKFGSVGGGTGAGLLALASYRIAAIGSGGFSIGGLFSMSGDHWQNKGLGSNVVPATTGTGGTCLVPIKESATALSGYGIGAVAFPITDHLKLGGIAGFGLTGISHDELGSDVFQPQCNPKPGVRPAFLFGAELDYLIGSVFRITAFPLTWHLQPAFDGVRAQPRDATGVWMRFSVGVGLGVDL